MTIHSETDSRGSESLSPSPGAAVAQGRRMRARFAVHLGLLAAFAASLATVAWITEGLAPPGRRAGVRGAGRCALGATPPRRGAVARKPGPCPHVVPPPGAADLIGRNLGPVDPQRARVRELRPCLRQSGDPPPAQHRDPVPRHRVACGVGPRAARVPLRARGAPLGPHPPFAIS
jgi:hypothetical protein